MGASRGVRVAESEMFPPAFTYVSERSWSRRKHVTRKIWFAVGLIMTLGGQAGVALAQAPEPAVESLRSCRPEVTWSANAPETIGLLAAVCPRDQRLSGAWQVTLAAAQGTWRRRRAR